MSSRVARTAVAAPAPQPRGVGAGAVLRGLASDEQIRLPARASVGRGPDCAVVLDDDSVSRKHAELSRDERGFYRLRDLDSANGTFLDGRRVGKEPLLVPEGARLRFGEVELLFSRPPERPRPERRQKLLVAALVAAIFGAAVVIVLWPARGEVGQSAPPAPRAQVAALADQAQAAFEGERFDEAARLAGEAVDQDPVSKAARKLLAQARREQESQSTLQEAGAKAQVGRPDEALRLLARVAPDSRLFARARIKAKELGAAVLRASGAACSSTPRERAREVAQECARALDVKCQQGPVEADPMLGALRAAENDLGRRVLWSCPRELGPLFRDERAPESVVDEAALAAVYLDASVRASVAQYARGEVTAALRALARAASARAPGAAEALQLVKTVDGRFREGQTALLSGALDRADRLWAEALRGDGELMPAGAESFSGGQMRAMLARAHARAGDEKLRKMQYSSAYDEYGKGLAVSPRDPHLLDQLAQLERTAEKMVGPDAACDELAAAVHVTRAQPPSPAHEAAQKALARCR